MFYAGIGSRVTPDFFLSRIERYSKALSDLGYILRSGGAGGADSAFEKVLNPNQREVFTEKDATVEAIEHASKYHPAWNKCNDLMKRFHGRNSMIILGKDLKTPVDFVICYTLNGEPSGGTGQGIRVAIANKIPVYNLFHEKQAISLDNLILSMRQKRDNNLKPIS